MPSPGRGIAPGPRQPRGRLSGDRALESHPFSHEVRNEVVEEFISRNVKETQRSPQRCYAIAKPSEVAKLSGTPHSLIITGLAVGGRALRASRSAQQRR
jgi:hypothetical protein